MRNSKLCITRGWGRKYSLMGAVPPGIFIGALSEESDFATKANGFFKGHEEDAETRDSVMCTP